MSKSIIKNSIYNIIYKGFTALFPLVTTAYISRVLMAEGVGKVSYANTVVNYFVLIAALGIPNYGIKAIAQHKTSKSERSATVAELFIINAISTTICAFAYYLMVNIVPYFSNRASIFNVFGSLIILNYFNFDWFYQGIEEYGYIATRSIIIKILSFILMLIFVKDSSDCNIYAGILCVATAGNYILNAFNLRKYISKTDVKLGLKKHVKPILILLASTLAQEIYTMLDTVMLEYFHGEIYVGYYSNSVKVIRMVYTLTIAMVGAFYPRISQYLKNYEYEKSNNLLSKGTKLIFLIAVPCVVGIFTISNLLVPIFFGKSFMPAISTIKILSPLVFVFSIAYFLGHIVLMASGREKYILRATIAGAVTNFIINSVLIPSFKQNGAAIASVIAEIVVTLVLLIYSSSVFKLNISRRYFISVIFSSLIMGICAYTISMIKITNILKLLIAVLTGILVYFILLYILKNDLIIEIKKQLYIKMKGQTK